MHFLHLILVSRLSSFSDTSRKYFFSTSSHSPHKFTTMFYFNVFTLWQQKFDFKSTFMISSTFSSIGNFFCSSKSSVIEIIVGSSPRRLLSLPLVENDLNKKLISFRSFKVLFSPVEFSIFSLILLAIFIKMSWIAPSSASKFCVIFSCSMCFSLNIFSNNIKNLSASESITSSSMLLLALPSTLSDSGTYFFYTF